MTHADGGRPPDEQIGYLLKRLMHQFRHQVEERLRRGCDMSLAHLVTLDQLQQQPGVAGARLARRLLVTAQTMTGLLRRLEKEGAIGRVIMNWPEKANSQDSEMVWALDAALKAADADYDVIRCTQLRFRALPVAVGVLVVALAVFFTLTGQIISVFFLLPVALLGWFVFLRPVHRRRYRRAIADLPRWELHPE